MQRSTEGCDKAYRLRTLTAVSHSVVYDGRRRMLDDIRQRTRVALTGLRARAASGPPRTAWDVSATGTSLDGGVPCPLKLIHVDGARADSQGTDLVERGAASMEAVTPAHPTARSKPRRSRSGRPSMGAGTIAPASTAGTSAGEAGGGTGLPCSSPSLRDVPTRKQHPQRRSARSSAAQAAGRSPRTCGCMRATTLPQHSSFVRKRTEALHGMWAA